MFGSQALETAIGLAVLFFIVATAASAMLEVIARLAKKRAKDLEKGIKDLLVGSSKEADKENGKEKEDGPDTALDLFKKTSIWQSAQLAAGRTLWRRKSNGPSYLSAKAFAEAVTEFLGENPKKWDPEAADAIPGVQWPPNLEKRLAAMALEGQTSILALKSGLERWFDEAMARAEGSYKRWATMILFFIGLLIAGAGNVSAISAAEELWTNPVARAEIADAATQIEEDRDESTTDPNAGYESFTDAIDQLDELGFPVGWDEEARQVWKDAVNPQEPDDRDMWAAVAVVAGWLLTAALVMLGAPFWFDLLTRLVALRGSGTKPPPAADDKASATRVLEAAATSNTPPPQDDDGAFAEKVGIRAKTTAGTGTAKGTDTSTAAVVSTSADAQIDTKTGKVTGDEHLHGSRWRRAARTLGEAIRIAFTGK